MHNRPMGVSSKSDCGNQCQCQVTNDKSNSKASKDNLFSPIKNKMKVLKKIKKRMGLGRSRAFNLCIFVRKNKTKRLNSAPLWMRLSWCRLIGNASCKKSRRVNDSSIMVLREDAAEEKSSHENVSPNPVAFYLLTSARSSLMRRIFSTPEPI